MTYATRQDLVERFGAAEVEDLETGTSDDDDTTRIAAALADAAAEIDAALATRYVLPLPDGRWPRLVGIACDLARLRLYDDAPPEAAVNREGGQAMTLAQTKRNNVVIGGGELFLDIFDAAGARTGELYLGDAVGATLGIVTEETTIFSGTGKVAVELARITRSISRTFNIGVRDMSLQNLALFAIGDLADDAIAADAVADETIAPVLPGRWYQLGTTAKRPAGINKVGKVTVAGGTVDAAGDFTAAAGANAWAKDADYVVDEGSGRVMILDTAKTKAAGAAIQVDYTPAAQADRQQVQAKTKQVEGAFRYIEDAARGQGRNFYAPDCLIRPNGELPLLDGRNSEQQIALTVAALEPGGGLPALLIDGQPQE